MSSAPEFFKPPAATLDYSVDWTAELKLAGTTIATSFWTLACAQTDSPGATSLAFSDSVTPTFGASPTPQFLQGGTSFGQYITTVIVSGGTLGVSYTLENVITTNQSPPRRYAQQMTITVSN